MKVRGKASTTGTQRIGWDPRQKQIRSWVFDSDGGFSEGFISRDGERWVMKSTGVLKDGRTASATNVLTRVNRDTMKWTSVDRTLGAEVLPDAEEITLVRTPPQPRSARPRSQDSPAREDPAMKTMIGLPLAVALIFSLAEGTALAQRGGGRAGGARPGRGCQCGRQALVQSHPLVQRASARRPGRRCRGRRAPGPGGPTESRSGQVARPNPGRPRSPGPIPRRVRSRRPNPGPGQVARPNPGRSGRTAQSCARARAIGRSTGKPGAGRTSADPGKSAEHRQQLRQHDRQLGPTSATTPATPTINRPNIGNNSGNTTVNRPNIGNNSGNTTVNRPNNNVNVGVNRPGPVNSGNNITVNNINNNNVNVNRNVNNVNVNRPSWVSGSPNWAYRPGNAYHQGWVNGYWHGQNNSNWWNSGGAFMTGMAVGGIGAWGIGSAVYGWGYRPYVNPYYAMAPVVVQQPVVVTQPTTVVVQQPVPAQQPAVAAAAAPVDYSQPLSTSAPPPEPAVADPAMQTFDAARAAFKAGNYPEALAEDGRGPQDPAQRRRDQRVPRLCLFALKQYDPGRRHALRGALGRPRLGLDHAERSLPERGRLHRPGAGSRGIPDRESAIGLGTVRAGLPLPDPGAHRGRRRGAERGGEAPAQRSALHAARRRSSPAARRAPRPRRPRPPPALRPPKPLPPPHHKAISWVPGRPVRAQGTTIELTLGGDSKFNWNVVVPGQDPADLGNLHLRERRAQPDPEREQCHGRKGRLERRRPFQLPGHGRRPQ